MRRAITFDSLEILYSRSEAVQNGGSHGAGWSAHAAIMDRLEANQRVAQLLGWTSCAIERLGRGRFKAWGVPPGDSRRWRIPDWVSERE